ncbi:hypothetical protein [Paenibacillus agilis]|uniref:Uncharacterized protein n=1 Tax=Paenibacillus agilis TaxID=3020863 RepID=A0A559ID33_9BACL|nr:hypothetical protein [Paenibacillus agilis]TVX85544.1 hypothetical protein FPZ44_24620 [Paenibacillus agilis]
MKKENNELQPYWYDVWSDDQGNYAYINTNISPEQFIEYENDFTSTCSKEVDQEWEEYENQFLSYLRERNHIVHVINRPNQFLDLGKHYR